MSMYLYKYSTANVQHVVGGGTWLGAAKTLFYTLYCTNRYIHSQTRTARLTYGLRKLRLAEDFEILSLSPDFEMLRLAGLRCNVLKSGIRRKVSKSGVRRNISKSSARRNFLWPSVRRVSWVAYMYCTSSCVSNINSIHKSIFYIATNFLEEIKKFFACAFENDNFCGFNIIAIILSLIHYPKRTTICVLYRHVSPIPSLSQMTTETAGTLYRLWPGRDNNYTLSTIITIMYMNTKILHVHYVQNYKYFLTRLTYSIDFYI